MKESLKPIEPGCLALIFRPFTNGSKHPCTIRVGDVLHITIESPKRPGFWKAEELHSGQCFDEKGLIRIDPDDEIRKDEEIQDELDKLDAVLRKAGVREG